MPLVKKCILTAHVFLCKESKSSISHGGMETYIDGMSEKTLAKPSTVQGQSLSSLSWSLNHFGNHLQLTSTFLFRLVELNQLQKWDYNWQETPKYTDEWFSIFLKATWIWRHFKSETRTSLITWDEAEGTEKTEIKRSIFWPIFEFYLKCQTKIAPTHRYGLDQLEMRISGKTKHKTKQNPENTYSVSEKPLI